MRFISFLAALTVLLFTASAANSQGANVTHGSSTITVSFTIQIPLCAGLGAMTAKVDLTATNKFVSLNTGNGIGHDTVVVITSGFATAGAYSWELAGHGIRTVIGVSGVNQLNEIVMTKTHYLSENLSVPNLKLNNGYIAILHDGVINPNVSLPHVTGVLTCLGVA